MRLQRFMADAGVASRRKCEEIIRAGRVWVNGHAATLGCSVDPDLDVIELDGKRLYLQQNRIAMVLNKPQGVLCTASDPQGRATVMDYIQELPIRVYSAGRLDYDSEGLLVMTNDGELAYRLTHPSFEMSKTYFVICDGELTEHERAALEKGLMLEDGMTSPARVTDVRRLKNGNTAFNVSIHEGRNRQVRRMLGAVGHETLLLRRVALGPLVLGKLPLGSFRPFTSKEKDTLARMLQYPPILTYKQLE